MYRPSCEIGLLGLTKQQVKTQVRMHTLTNNSEITVLWCLI